MAKRGAVRGEGVSSGHAKEIYGVVFLAASVFLTLCLFSYNSLDPSFSTLAVGRKVQNLGGSVGSHLADLLLVAFGYGGYLIPFALFAISVTHFAQRNLKDLRFGWPRIVAYFFLIVFFALFNHLKFGEVELGGRLIDGGGVIGWWAGGKAVRFFGRPGSYLLVTSGILLSILMITRLSLVRLAKLLQGVGLAFFRKVQAVLASMAVIAWVRFRKNLEKIAAGLKARLQAKWKDWRKSRRQPTVHRPALASFTSSSERRAAESGPVVVPVGQVLKMPQRPAPVEKAPPVSTPLVAREPQEQHEPKILPRVDLKEGKRKNQMDLISPIFAEHQIPQLSYLDSESQVTIKVDEESLKLNSKVLERKLLDYDVEGRITEIHPGPVITMYEFEPAAGVKVNKIVNLEDDLSLTMGGKSVRIIAPLPGKAAVGIEIPNNVRETVWLKDVIGHPKFQKADSKLTLAIGKDTEGIPFVTDLAKMPHLLVAGATGAGKSVCINSMILSVLYKATPKDVRMILIDPKMLELSIYEKIPHLLLPVVVQPKQASMALRWAVREMERRYEVLSQKGSRHILGYNKSVPDEEKMPYIMIVIDELADLMMTAAKDVEMSVTRLAQMARAAGIHLILATQRPSVDVLTGLIKANFPVRISFKVSSKHDSRTIIDTVGAEHLLGFGDMLFMAGGPSNMLRVHGAFVSETEINRVVEHWRNQGQPELLDESVLKPVDEESSPGGVEEDFSDDLYDQAVSIVVDTRQASISSIQRRLRIGYNRAARLIERMEKEGVVGPADGAKAREVFAGNLSSNEG